MTNYRLEFVPFQSFSSLHKLHIFVFQELLCGIHYSYVCWQYGHFHTFMYNLECASYINNNIILSMKRIETQSITMHCFSLLRRLQMLRFQPQWIWGKDCSESTKHRQPTTPNSWTSPKLYILQLSPLKGNFLV